MELQLLRSGHPGGIADLDARKKAFEVPYRHAHGENSGAKKRGHADEKRGGTADCKFLEGGSLSRRMKYAYESTNDACSSDYENGVSAPK